MQRPLLKNADRILSQTGSLYRSDWASACPYHREADPHATRDERPEAAQLKSNAMNIQKRLWKINGSHVKQVTEDEGEKWAWLVTAWYR
jgi:hypothetical protein